MKKSVSILLALLVVISSMATLFSVSAVTTSVNGEVCEVGDYIVYNTNIQIPEKLEDIQTQILYSGEGLKFVNCTYSDELYKGSFYYNHDNDSQINFNSITIVNNMNFTSEKTLCSAVFEVVKDGVWSVKTNLERADSVTEKVYSNIPSSGFLSCDVKTTTKLAKFSVSYDANGGKNAPQPQIKTAHDIKLSSEIPTKTNYKFLGWSESKTAKTPDYKAGDMFTKNQDVVLYAVWQAKKTQTITVSKTTVTKAIGSKAFSVGAKTNGGGKLTYSSDNKKVATVSASGKVTVKAYGKAVITVKAAETSAYKSATKKVTVNVVPATLKSVKVVPTKSKATVSWKTVKSVSGYTVQYSLKKNFASKKTINAGAKKKSVVMKSLKKGKTYYARVRAYKNVSGKKYCGAWVKKSFKAK